MSKYLLWSKTNLILLFRHIVSVFTSASLIFLESLECLWYKFSKLINPKITQSTFKGNFLGFYLVATIAPLESSMDLDLFFLCALLAIKKLFSSSDECMFKVSVIFLVIASMESNEASRSWADQPSSSLFPPWTSILNLSFASSIFEHSKSAFPRSCSASLAPSDKLSSSWCPFLLSS